MKTLKYILAITLILLTACTKDPLKDISDGTDWQKDRNILTLLVEGQIGTAVIEREGGLASAKIYAKYENITDISKVEVKNIELSYGATTPNGVGTTLDFTSGEATLTVVSGSGEELDWVISIFPFKSDLEGTWYVKDLRFYCDMFTWESWGWTVNKSFPAVLPQSAAELDNVLTFTVEGADENGNPYGKYTHAAGNDASYGDFANDAQGWDFNERFRVMPKGEGTWLRDFARNKVVITDQYLVEHEFDLDLLGDSADLDLKAPLEYLNGLFNWDNTDWTYEELAHMSNPMWYTLTKTYVAQTGNSITSFAIENQVEAATFDGDNKTITVLYPNDDSDISALRITALGISYGASATAQVGDVLDFSNNNEPTIAITSEAGETATWTIKLQLDLKADDVSIAGSWTISEMGMYCDLFTWESWGWDKNVKITDYLPNAQAEMDNVITFTVEGTNAEGKTYGNYENNAGTDGAYANFASDDASWPTKDFNERYRKVPSAAGTWVMNADTVIITETGGESFSLVLEIKSDTEIALSTALELKAQNFVWSKDENDNDNTNYAYNETAFMSSKMWYNLNKQ